MDRTEVGACPIRRSFICRYKSWLVALAISTLAVAAMVGGCGETGPTGITDSTVVPPASTTPPQTSSPAAGSGLPQLIDLGSDSCIPCQLMTPELEALAREYAGSVEVVIADVNNTEEGAALAKQLGIRVIPTQIFIDAAGNELSRHEGYISKDDMVALFQQLGHPLKRIGPVNPDTTQGGA